MLFGIWSILLLACQEDIDQADADDEMYTNELAESEALLAREVDELWQFSEEASAATENGRVQSSYCATATVHGNTLVLDFGSGCTGPVYGRVRTGKVMIQQDSTGRSHTITFDNYSVDGRGVEGQIEVERAADYGSATRTLTHLTVTYEDGKTTVISGTEQVQWVGGQGDGDPKNNLFKITGTLSGTDRAGRSFTSVTIEPILVNLGCDKYLRVSGIKEVTLEENRKHTIDFGDGSCDNVITVTTPRRTFEVTMR